jgi:hypothetical protein
MSHKGISVRKDCGFRCLEVPNGRLRNLLEHLATAELCPDYLQYVPFVDDRESPQVLT